MWKKRTSRFFLYLLGGGVGTLVYVGLLYVLSTLNSNLFVLWSAIAFIVSHGVSFPFQKFWTFRNRELRTIKKQMFWYFALGVVYLLVNAGLLHFWVYYEHWQMPVAVGVNFVSLGPPSLALNYLIFRR
jgi:putative flippase GtrA